LQNGLEIEGHSDLRLGHGIKQRPCDNGDGDLLRHPRGLKPIPKNLLFNAGLEGLLHPLVLP
jgi:hypothetical protein